MLYFVCFQNFKVVVVWLRKKIIKIFFCFSLNRLPSFFLLDCFRNDKELIACHSFVHHDDDLGFFYFKTDWKSIEREREGERLWIIIMIIMDRHDNKTWKNIWFFFMIFGVFFFILQKITYQKKTRKMRKFISRLYYYIDKTNLNLWCVCLCDFLMIALLIIAWS